MRAVGRVAILVLLWLLAWGELTVANVLSGTAAAVALLVAFPPRHDRDADVQLSFAGLWRLAAYVASQLVKSNIVMAYQILRPPKPLTPGVVGHRLRHPSEHVITLVSSIIALSPGTMIVDVASDSSSIYVHFFHLGDVDGARRSIAHLEDLAIAAIANPPRGTLPTEEET
jgi:multicomponent Na+:H+ antiporter subunit E